MPEYTEEHLMGVARDVVEKKTNNSVVLDVEAEKRIPKFQMSELSIGKVLGRGGFCVVSEITKITLKSDICSNKDNDDENGASNRRRSSVSLEEEHHFANIVQDRSFMSKHCIRQGKDCRYALKMVQDSSKKDPQTYVNGVVDLAIEARFLSVIRHPNIIKMRATATGTPYRGTFFVALDKLFDILSGRLLKWKKRLPGRMSKLTDRDGKKALAFWVERITVAYDLACALKYLHDLHILYRDLKPDNIGFDVRGDVKIFDFGLAKEIDPRARSDDGTYKLTKDTGSPRYMAPEVAMGKRYNETCDVYAFCILLWQMVKVELPFEGFSVKIFQKKVVEGGARPKPDPKWPDDLSDMLRLGWNVDLQKRPSMEDVSETLREIINRDTDEEIDKIMDISRKSELSAHGINY